MKIKIPKLPNIKAAIAKKTSTTKKKNEAAKKLAKFKKITFKKLKKL